MIEELIKKIVEEEVTRQLADLHHEEPQPVEEKLLTTAEACEYLRVSKPTLHRWKRENIIPHVRLGGNIRYKLSDLIKKTN
ncbi:MAG: helix-turn-helix domain-containing protein [Bacteroides sp.]|nr:helix-turn-helix domain-containing protein [Bacteroides sp.]MDD4055334.1 helix-turn-helix domain-containing protein [Bacteroides sp.]MDD4720855.1 helix-turn-helix domain-containing protein [Bacteroides sp.]